MGYIITATFPDNATTTVIVDGWNLDASIETLFEMGAVAVQSKREDE